MEPLLATGLVALGKGLIDFIIPDSKPEASKESFSNILNSKEATHIHPLTESLVQNNINTGQDLKNHINIATQHLIQHPDLASQMSSMGTQTSLSLIREESGQFSIVNSQGKKISLEKGSATEHLAEYIHGLKSIQSLHNQLPSSNLHDLSNQVSTHPVLTAAWGIRTSTL